MKTLLLIAVTCSFVLPASAQDLFPLKRQPYTLILSVDKSRTYREDLGETNYVLKDQTCQLYAGEKVFLEIEQENGVVKNVRAVTENKFPAKTLIIGFAQVAKKKTHQSMMLTVQNPFKLALIYEAKIYLVDYKKWVNTKVIPVQPGLSAYETWPELISSIAVGEWGFVTSTEQH
jgi:hypothetical protein